MTGPIISKSAYRHGMNDEEILHALRNPMVVHEEDDLTMIVGAHPSGWLMEVGVVASDDGELVVVHAMEARERYLPGQRRDV